MTAGSWGRDNGLLQSDFQIQAVAEEMPPENVVALPGMPDEMRRSMMLLVKTRKMES